MPLLEKDDRATGAMVYLKAGAWAKRMVWGEPLRVVLGDWSLVEEENLGIWFMWCHKWCEGFLLLPLGSI